jgi:non-ribosomal peptide synthetase component E (peptide arylation enzyme)
MPAADGRPASGGLSDARAHGRSGRGAPAAGAAPRGDAGRRGRHGELRRSYYHRGGDEPLRGATIPEHFAGVAARWADREAVVGLPQRRRLSYAGLAAAVDELARGLVALGFGRGDRVGVWSTNNVEWLLVQMATARIGAVLVNINPA